MFGVKKRVENARQAIVQGLQKKSISIMQAYAHLPVEQIPKHDLARAMVLHDIAEVLLGIHVDDSADEKG